MSTPAEQSGAPVRVWLRESAHEAGRWLVVALRADATILGDVGFVRDDLVRELVEALEPFMVPLQVAEYRWARMCEAEEDTTLPDDFRAFPETLVERDRLPSIAHARAIRAALARIREGTEP
jgi:hypothetical protein